MVKKNLDGGRRLNVVGMKFLVSVTPIQAPQSSFLGVAQPCDGRAGVVAFAIPGWANFNDGDVAGSNIPLNLDFIPQVFRDTGVAPALDAGEIEFWNCHALDNTGRR
ncbi:hypothetical protein CPHO_06760 [Corynebacterium phocae]|uniref:Uncharacterized protein n=1 Tax=Corynebacterium phocae TaxID=161895 RepID=A0A1L7D3Y7_9CORY|nr:hypothetical protein CPHO_06760 [Corynebacterium phocae]